jgi:hypothetical protein
VFAGYDNTGVAGTTRSIVNVHWFEELTLPARSTAFTYHVWVPWRTLVHVNVVVFETVVPANAPLVYTRYPVIP